MAELSNSKCSAQGCVILLKPRVDIFKGLIDAANLPFEPSITAKAQYSTQ